MCRVLPARVVRIEGDIAWVTPATDHAASPLPVLLAGISDVTVGDHIIYHAGLAVARLEPEDVDLILAAWDELLALADAEQPELAGPSDVERVTP